MPLHALIPYLILFLFLILFSAFFSSAETALLSISRIKLAHQAKKKNKKAVILSAILDRPEEFFSTILIGNTIIGVALAALGFAVAEKLFPDLGELVAIIAVTVLLVVFGDALPKRIGLLFGERLAPLHALIL